jgi:hypothetical protein
VLAVALSLGLLALVASGGCRRGVAVVDLDASAPDVRATLTGTVRGPEGTNAIPGRDVVILNTDTGARHAAQTGANGGFAIQLPAGQYRVDLPVRAGETLVKRPGLVTLGKGDIDSHIEFVLGPARIVRPRGPAYRLDNGLGAPIT